MIKGMKNVKREWIEGQNTMILILLINLLWTFLSYEATKGIRILYVSVTTLH
jgi:hypothetical protein